MAARGSRLTDDTVGWAAVVVLGVLLACVLWAMLVMGEGVEAALRLGLVAVPVAAWAVAYRLARTDWPRQPSRTIAATLASLGVAIAVLFVALFLWII
ncbi:MAG: hypothetical protein ABIX10_00405 [Acidimicrobiales bacterium]